MTAALLASLSGCWTGDPWFAASEAVTVIPDGQYRLVEQGAPPEVGDHIRVRRQPDNSLLLTGSDNPWRAIIVPLGPAGQSRFIVQLQEQNPRHSTHALIVLLNAAGRRYRIAVLACAGGAQQAARTSGGIVTHDPQSAASCVFADRATLSAQMLAAAEDSAFGLELVKDGGR